MTEKDRVLKSKQDNAFKLITGGNEHIESVLNEYNKDFVVSIKSMIVGNDGMNRVLFVYSNKNAVTNL